MTRSPVVAAVTHSTPEVMTMIRTPAAIAAATLLVSTVLATGSTPAMATSRPAASHAFTTAQAVTGDDATLTGLTATTSPDA